MTKSLPRRISLDHDDYHACYVGRAEDGRQFFLTRPFVPAMGGGPGREFVALYLFDPDGALIEARIEDMGTRAEIEEGRAEALRDKMLASLGDVAYQRIEFAPFKIERFGVDFGFIAQPPEDPDEDWRVTAEPGDFMCFWPPWTNGDYDT